MKFISMFEEQNKIQNDDWQYQYSKANKIVENEVGKTKLCLFIDSHDLNFDLHNIRNESSGLIDDFKKLVDNLDGNVKNKSVLVDTAIEADKGGGGYEMDLIPSFSTMLKVFLVFVVAQSATGFLQEAGKEFYKWIKEKMKLFHYKGVKHVYVILRGKKQEAKFLFQSNFSESTFERAWKEMLKVDVDKLDIEEYEERIYVFDTRENKWVIFN